MNKKGMELLSAMDGVSEEMLADALPPGMGVYKEKQKSHRLAGFFEHPWVAGVLSAAVALAVLTGIVWAGQRAGKEPFDPSGSVGGHPSGSMSDAQQDGNTYPYETDIWPDYDNPPIPEDAKVVISSGGYSIAPSEYIQWKDVWNPEEGKMEEVRGDEQWITYLEEVDSGADMSQRREILQNLPRIPFVRGDFWTEILHPTLEFYAASAYDDDLRHAFSASLDQNFDSAWSLEEMLEQLSPGCYCVLLIAYDKGNYIEAADDYEDAMYEFLFLVDVRDTTPTAPPEPPVEHPDIQAAMGMELWVGDQNPTYQQLKPYVTSAHLYQDEEGVWADIGGHGVDEWLKSGLVDFPTLTYAPGFRFFFKPADKMVGEASLDRMTVYSGEDFMFYEDHHDVTEDLWQLSQLKPGTYLVSFLAYHKGREFDGQSEEGTYEYAFRLIVPNEYETIHPTIEEPRPDDVFLDVNGKTVYPAGRNEWTRADLSDHLGALPAIPDQGCRLVYPDSSYSLCSLTVYRTDGEYLTQVYDSFHPDFSVLQGLEAGDYCVTFSVQHPDKSEDGVMLLRSYAFLLYVGYEASTGVEH